MRHFNKRLSLAACLIFAVIIVGITSVYGLEAAKNKVSIGKKKLELYVGQSFKLNNKKYNWKTSNKKIVSVDKRGKVKAKKAGVCKVTASKKIGKKVKKAVCSVKVGSYAVKINLMSADTVILNAGQTKKISAKVMPDTVLYKDMTYRSDNSEVAVVNKSGVITAVSTGISKISIVSKAVNSKKKNVIATITVVVPDTEEPIVVPGVLPGEDVGKTTSGWELIIPTESPVISTPTAKPEKTMEPAPTADPDITPAPGATSTPESTPTPEPTPTPTKAPMTIKEYVQSLKPSGTSALVGTFLARDTTSGAIRTVYLLDRNYTGTVGLTIDEFSFSHSGNVDSLLNKLETEYVSVTENQVRLRRLKRDNTEFWTVTFLQTGTSYQFIGRKNDVSSANYIDDYAPYGVIIALGNTLSNIKIH